MDYQCIFVYLGVSKLSALLLIILYNIHTCQGRHRLNGDRCHCTMSEEAENLAIRLDFSLLFVFDLSAHEGELLLGLVGVQILADSYEFDASLFNLAASDELSRRVGHEGKKANEHDDSPRDLYAQG